MRTPPLLPEEDHLALKSDLDSFIPPHQRLHSFSSATSTEETVFSEDDSDDSDSDDDDDHPEVNENTLEDNHDNEEQSIEEGSIDSIDEGQQHVEAPPFETLVRDDDPLRAMSFSVNEEMVEVVPTDMVESVVSFVLMDEFLCLEFLLGVLADYIDMELSGLFELRMCIHVRMTGEFW